MTVPSCYIQSPRLFLVRRVKEKYRRIGWSTEEQILALISKPRRGPQVEGTFMILQIRINVIGSLFSVKESNLYYWRMDLVRSLEELNN